jgi:hypothetical protein
VVGSLRHSQQNFAHEKRKRQNEREVVRNVVQEQFHFFSLSRLSLQVGDSESRYERFRRMGRAKTFSTVTRNASCAASEQTLQARMGDSLDEV